MFLSSFPFAPFTEDFVTLNILHERLFIKVSNDSPSNVESNVNISDLLE